MVILWSLPFPCFLTDSLIGISCPFILPLQVHLYRPSFLIYSWRISYTVFFTIFISIPYSQAILPPFISHFMFFLSLKKTKRRENSTKKHGVWFVLDKCLWAWILPGKLLIHPGSLHQRKPISPLPVAIICEQLLARARSLYPPPLLCARILSFLSMSRACFHCLCEFIQVSALLRLSP